jgi:anti-sigma factor RsiW
MMGARISDDELHAFADGELPDDRRADVEAWLAAHPEDAARVATWRAQANVIRAHFSRVAEEPLPPRFNIDALARAPTGRWVMAAAACVLVIAGAAGGWYGRAFWDGPPAARTVVAEALGAHRLYIAEMRHPIEVPADAAHLMPWLSRRVGSELRAPDLQRFGLKLIGGRLLPGPKSPAAMFMYEGPSGERFTLYCARTAAPDTALRYTAEGQVAAFYWVERELSFVVSGPADRTRLHGVAESAYEQMEKLARRDKAT